MEVLPGLIALGVVQGMLSALFAAGLVLAHRTHRFLNLSHAGLGLVPGALVGVLVAQAGWSFWGAAPVGIALGAALGVAAERAVFARLANAPRLILMVGSLGLAQLLAAAQTALPLAVGGIPPTYSVPWRVRIDIFPVVLTAAHVLTLIAVPITLVLLAAFLRSRVGLGAQAVGQNSERARSLGVSAGVVSATAFAVVGAAAAVAGILAVPVLGYSLEGSPGVAVLLLALAPAAVAGFRQLWLAAAAAIVLGVVYQLVLWYGGEASNGTLLLGAVAAMAVALRPPAGDRRERAARTSSWPAAPPIRPSTRRRSTSIGLAFGIFAVSAVAITRLGPSDAQLVATGAALALGALSLAIGWCLAGELSLITWPVAGVAAIAGAWSGRAGVWLAPPVAAATGAIVLCALGLLVRRRGGLAFAVVSLAAGAGLAEVARRTTIDAAGLEIAPSIAALVALAVAFSATAAFSVLRGTAAGHRLVAARDDGRRARALGIAPSQARLLGLGLSGAVAGIAGLAYVLAVSHPAPGAFGADRSLDLLAMAVVGGLGSFWGAAAGTATLVAARVLLDGGWAVLGSGIGMLAAVLFFPGGLAAAAARAIEAARR
ncbi:MAG TPA: hypothetical protein VMY88_10695 [Acidimicrobiales bacterium]|nr:hypothetical protein [Acidimicrobiales bacterium]